MKLKQNWSIVKIYNLYSVLIVSVLVFCIIMLVYAYNIWQGLNEKFDIRYRSYQLADELRQSSDDLTRLARTYVITGDPRYEKAYMDILDIRNGKKIRPDAYNQIYWDLVLTGNETDLRPGSDAIPLRTLMEEAGFTKEEFAKLQEAQNNSDDLVKTETIAMNVIKEYMKNAHDSTFKASISRDSAVRMMHNLAYHQYKYKIMKPIDEFFELLDKRTLKDVSYYQEKNKTVLFLLLLFPLSVFSILAIFYAVMRKRVILPIVKLNEYSSAIAMGEFGSKIEIMHEDEIGNLSSAINTMAQGMVDKSVFVNEIGKANLDVELKPLSDKDSMAYALLQMKENLYQISVEEKKRNWAVEGFARFGESLRRTGTVQEVFDNVLAELVKYMNANQAVLFIVNEDDRNNVHLELLSCYAWGKKKFVDKKIVPGEGLTGQAWQEKGMVYLTDVPMEYVRITSGLGEALPRSVIIVPLMTNDEVLGIIEIASFNPIALHERDFLTKMAENIASVLSTSRIAERTRKLLEQSQHQAEELRNQEEEMRQNMEEISATQEEMGRKEKEYLTKIAELEKRLACELTSVK